VWQKQRANINLEGPPEAITKQLLSIGPQRSLKELKAVTSSPFLKADGNVLNRTGYDHDTKLFLTSSIVSLNLNDAVDTQSLKAALATIWTPFKHFPFIGDVDRSLMLASIFTAIQRPAMPTAPASDLMCLCRGVERHCLPRPLDSYVWVRNLLSGLTLAETVTKKYVKGCFPRLKVVSATLYGITFWACSIPKPSHHF